MECKIPDANSNGDLRPVVLEWWTTGRTTYDLPSVIGISKQRVDEYIEWTKRRSGYRAPDGRRPILISETSPTSYISLN